MSDRIIRDELLRSERYWSVSIEAQRLFVHLLLNADDMARFSGKNFTIRSACFPGQAVDPGKVEKLLCELLDVDLIRLYENGGERFIFIPRFRQRLRFRNSRYPEPPIEINDLTVEKTDSSQTQDGLKSDSSQTQDRQREEKRREEKRSKPLEVSNDTSCQIAPRLDPIPYQKIVDLYHEHCPLLPRVMQLSDSRKASIRQRWRSGCLPDIETWEKFFRYVSSSRFLTGLAEAGNNRRPFVASLEWITKEANFLKIWEGKYHEQVRQTARAAL